MRVGILCDAISPHGTRCSLWLDHGGTHYDREAECVWEGVDYHMHDGRVVKSTLSPNRKGRSKLLNVNLSKIC